MAERRDHPKLTMQQAMIEAPDAAVTAQIGDPMGQLGPLSGGPGGPFGIGIGNGASVGPGSGSGPAGQPVSYRALGITKMPELLHSVEPEYSEEARKSRMQGTVLLEIEVDANGRVSNVRVVKSLGLGLDEKAKEAVVQWRFRPAMAGGKAVAAPAQVRVTFHLL